MSLIDTSARDVLLANVVFTFHRLAAACDGIRYRQRGLRFKSEVCPIFQFRLKLLKIIYKLCLFFEVDVYCNEWRATPWSITTVLINFTPIKTSEQF